jgi:mono/diheme cytochrome c family protein
MRSVTVHAVLGAALALGLACGGEEPAAKGATPAVAVEPAAPAAAASGGARDEAEKIFAGRCFTCHGVNGEGNGPGSAALIPPPRNFTDPTWQASVTDDHLAKIIQYGGAAVGKSPTMPGNPDLMSKPEIVQALVAHIRGLGPAQ